jgi:hypothetical protein
MELMHAVAARKIIASDELVRCIDVLVIASLVRAWFQ